MHHQSPEHTARRAIKVFPATVFTHFQVSVLYIYARKIRWAICYYCICHLTMCSVYTNRAIHLLTFYPLSPTSPFSSSAASSPPPLPVDARVPYAASPPPSTSFPSRSSSSATFGVKVLTSRTIRSQGKREVHDMHLIIREFSCWIHYFYYYLILVFLPSDSSVHAARASTLIPRKTFPERSGKRKGFERFFISFSWSWSFCPFFVFFGYCHSPKKIKQN